MRHFISSRHAVLVIALAFACSPGPGRHPAIRSSVECTSCSIELHSVWSSTTGDDNIRGSGFTFEVDDTLWMMGEDFGPAIARFPLDGSPGMLLEREGDGPGEFRWIVAGQSYPSGDTIVVVQNTRVSYLTRDMREVRSYPNLVPRPVGIVVLADGSLLSVNHRLNRPANAAGYALHQVSPMGEYTLSFRTTDSLSAGGVWPMMRVPDANQVWLVEPRQDGFVVELWDIGRTERLREFRVNPDWWLGETRSPEDYERMAGQKEQTPKLPSGTVGVWHGEGVLWIALRHFDSAASAEISYDVVHRWFDGVLLALDPISGSIITADVYDDFLLGFTNAGNLVFYSEDPEGRPRVRLARPELQRT
jgi:hypothetical protein